MANNMVKYLLWLFVLTWMGIIFALSDVPSSKSGNDSKNILSGIVSISTSVTNNIGLTNYNKSDLKRFVSKFNNVFREFMHSFVYFLLAILLLLALNTSNFERSYIITLIICIVYAFSDEVHQIFVFGRSFEMIDLILDTFGCIVGIVLYKFIKLLFI